MPENINIYNGNPTEGAQDGTLVDATNPILVVLQAGQNAESTPQKLAVRAIYGKKREGDYPIELTGEGADKWALAPDASGTAGTFGAFGETLTLAGATINAENTLIWAKAKVLLSETIEGATYDDTGVSFRIPTDVVDDVAFVDTQPEFLTGPTLTPGDTQLTLEATWDDGGDGETITAKYIIQENDATPPASGDWDTADAFDGSEIIATLTNEVPYYVWVQLTDESANEVVSDAVSATPTAGTNEAPTFTGDATVTAVTNTGCTVTASASDPEDDTLTYKVAVTESATPPVDWSSYAVKTHAEMAGGVAVSGLADATDYYAHVQVDDGNGNTVVSTSSLFVTYWSDDFGDASINTDIWHTDVVAPGAITEADGNLVMADADGSGKWVCQQKRPMTIGIAEKLTVNGIISAPDMGNQSGLGITGNNAIYPGDVADDFWNNLMVNVSFQTNAAVPDGRGWWISYWNASGVRYTWNAGSFNTTLMSTMTDAIVNGATYSIEFETNASSQWRVKITVGGVVLVTTTWVAFSATRAGASPRISNSDVGALITSTTYTSASLVAM